MLYPESARRRAAKRDAVREDSIRRYAPHLILIMQVPRSLCEFEDSIRRYAPHLVLIMQVRPFII